MTHPKIAAIRARRRAGGFTQVQLAKEAGMYQSLVARLELGGRASPAYDTVAKLEAALDRLEAAALKGKSTGAEGNTMEQMKGEVA
jgi:predicted transcriptional regulator